MNKARASWSGFGVWVLCELLAGCGGDGERPDVNLDEFQVNTQAVSGLYGSPFVVGNGGGQAMVAWIDRNGPQLRAQRILDDGSKDGSELRFGGSAGVPPEFYVSDLIAVAGGDLLAVWPSPVRLQGMRFAADGAPRGPAFAFDAGPGADVATANGESMVAAWTTRSDGLPAGNFARQFRADGTSTGSPIRLGTRPGTDANVAMASNGSFLAVTSEYSPRQSTQAQLFNADGTTKAGPIEIADGAYVNSVAATSDGGFVVLMSAYARVGGQVQFQRISRDGAKLGDLTPLAAPGPPGTSAFGYVAVAADGKFVIAWLSGQDGFDASEIRAQLFAADGSRSGSEITIQPPGGTGAAGVGFISASRFLVSWGGGADGPRANTVWAQLFEF